MTDNQKATGEPIKKHRSSIIRILKCREDDIAKILLVFKVNDGK